MENQNSKICRSCFLAQESAARFCDNCGQMFGMESSLPGYVTAATMTSFVRRQVVETRPLFWAGLIILSMVSVFGFAQAGLFDAPVQLQQQPVASQFVSRDDSVAAKQVAEQPVAANDALIDLNNSVFEMKDEPAGATIRQTSKRPRTQATLRSETGPTTEIAKPVAEQPKPVEEPMTTQAEPAVPKWEDTAKPTPPVKRTYTRGPMGGCFYISASGSKRYVDRSLCS